MKRSVGVSLRTISPSRQRNKGFTAVRLPFGFKKPVSGLPWRKLGSGKCLECLQMVCCKPSGIGYSTRFHPRMRAKEPPLRPEGEMRVQRYRGPSTELHFSKRSIQKEATLVSPCDRMLTVRRDVQARLSSSSALVPLAPTNHDSSN